MQAESPYAYVTLIKPFTQLSERVAVLTGRDEMRQWMSENTALHVDAVTYSVVYIRWGSSPADVQTAEVSTLDWNCGARWPEFQEWLTDYGSTTKA